MEKKIFYPVFSPSTTSSILNVTHTVLVKIWLLIRVKYKTKTEPFFFFSLFVPPFF